jgi:DNA-binding XRE family transcriptional regulator
MQWLALPKYERHPHRQKDFAHKLGVNESTLWRWKKEEGFLDEVNKIARRQIDKHLADIYGALVKKAKSGSYPHIKLALELAGHYVEKRVQMGDKNTPLHAKHSSTSTNEIGLSSLTDEQLEAYDAILAQLERTNAGATNPLSSANPN